ncbi:MAG: histone deacetylase family protein [Candidatus Limnocylindria bacterium]
MARVLLLTHEAMVHHAAPGHPERPERLAAVEAGVVDGTDAAGAELVRTTPEPAGDEVLARVHPARYLAALTAAEARGGGWIDPDTYLFPGSMAAARVAAAAMVLAATAAQEGVAAVAFAAVRPPGHHASRERSAGFCLLNNVAVAVEALRAADLARRIAVLDWDVHHGDGTQAIYAADPDLCYASTHQSPLYPGSGDGGERGSGPAEGTKHNLPLSPGSGDEAFTAAWLDGLLPAVEAFGPEAILVSAGYDAHRDDPLAQLEVTEAGFETVARQVGALAGRLKLTGVALALEGGYDLPALRRSVAATVEGLLAGLPQRA